MSDWNVYYVDSQLYQIKFIPDKLNTLHMCSTHPTCAVFMVNDLICFLNWTGDFMFFKSGSKMHYYVTDGHETLL